LATLARQDDLAELSARKSGTIPLMAALIIIYCLSEAVAVYGLVLHFFGFSLSQVTPFFFAGLMLLFFFEPRRVMGAAT